MRKALEGNHWFQVRASVTNALSWRVPSVRVSIASAVILALLLYMGCNFLGPVQIGGSSPPSVTVYIQIISGATVPSW